MSNLYESDPRFEDHHFRIPADIGTFDGKWNNQGLLVLNGQNNKLLLPYDAAAPLADWLAESTPDMSPERLAEVQEQREIAHSLDREALLTKLGGLGSVAGGVMSSLEEMINEMQESEVEGIDETANRLVGVTEILAGVQSDALEIEIEHELSGDEEELPDYSNAVRANKNSRPPSLVIDMGVIIKESTRSLEVEEARLLGEAVRAAREVAESRKSLFS